MEVKKLKQHSDWLQVLPKQSNNWRARWQELKWDLTQKWYDITGPITRYLEYRERLNAWKPIIKKDIDFDYHSIYAVLRFKLERLLTAMKTGHAIHEKEDLKALKSCIKLCINLEKDEYEEPYRKLHDKKWGKLKTWSTKVEGSENKPGGPYYRYHSSRPKVKTKQHEKQERKEFGLIWIKGCKDCQADFKKLMQIMVSHRRAWWD